MIQVGTTLDLRVILAMFLGTFASVVGFCLVFIIIIIVITIIIIFIIIIIIMNFIITR